MVDEFGGYRVLFAHGVTELGCLAHARRKFFDLNAAEPNAIAQEALARIAALYAIEAQGRDMTPAARTLLRREQSVPLLQSMQDWLLKTRVNVANGGGTAKAMDYSLRRWTALSRHALDGRLPIDNNPVENVIRPIAIGKKNWLFTGSERAGKRAAAIQSLLATAKLNGLDPAAWLRETLTQLPTCLNSQIDSLLPLRAEQVKENQHACIGGAVGRLRRRSARLRRERGGIGPQAVPPTALLPHPMGAWKNRPLARIHAAYQR